MKVLFAVSNEKMSQAIVAQYQKDYKEILSYKNVYYFNAILKELQKDKSYDRVVISEDLEQYVNADYEQMDNFIFGRLDSISDEAVNMRGEDIPIILICEERRQKGEDLLVKLWGLAIYNAILGKDRSINEVCRLINKPRAKKEAKAYYKINANDFEGPSGEHTDSDVSELEIQNILAYYKRIGDDEAKIVEAFDSIASQYNTVQLKVICQFLPLNIKAVLEEKSNKYAEVNAFNVGVSDNLRMSGKEGKQKRQSKKQPENTSGTSEVMLGENPKLKKPIVVPSAMSSNTLKKVTGNKVATNKVEQPMTRQNIKPITNEIEELVDTEDIDDVVEPIEEVEEQPVKRGRGRPRKIVEEPVEQAPKRKRGRPRKNPVPEEETTLPGFDDEDDDEIEEAVLPNFEKEPDEEETVLPGFDDEEEIEDNPILGFDDDDDDDEEEEEEEEEDDDDNLIPGFNDAITEDDDLLPGFDDEMSNDDILGFNNQKNTNDYSQPFNEPEEISYQEDNSQRDIFSENKVETYQELDLDSLMTPDQKLVSFVGTSKNGTSFLVNNVAEILSMNGVNTAILDLTRNRNAYYIYTKNEERLRNKANKCFKNLKEGVADGVEVHKGLTVYTSAFDIEDINDVEPIIQNLLQHHTIVLMDCDFETPERYFKYAQEIYLVQSMDILTIQPLTAFIRKLSDKNIFDESKARVVLNKYIRTKELNEDLLVGGISIYNDPEMTVRKELFNRRTVKRITIPFELKSYLRYLDGLVICDVSLKGYSKELLQSLKQLATLVYEKNGSQGKAKYAPPSVKNNANSSLNQMRRNY